MSAVPGAGAAPRFAISDSRRLTGPSLLLDGPGAVIDAAVDHATSGPLVAAWRQAITRLRAALHWPEGALASRDWAGGVSLAFEAPIDQLYAATDVNEWAAAAAAHAVGAGTSPEAFEAAVERLRATAAAESKPGWRAMREACARRGVTFLWDDQRCSIGLGSGSLTWPSDAMPETPVQIPWAAVHDVPCALVTGTNGKTTTVRLLGSIAKAAGMTAGVTSTDRVDVGDETVAVGDYSGPNGARTVLRDRRVDVGMLEVARGGILRRGLPVASARAAVVLNVDNDHLGEWGIFDVDALADAKLVVAKAVGPAGRVVLNADDPRLLERGQRLARPVLWFTLDASHATVRAHVAAGGDAAVLEVDRLVLYRGGARQDVMAAASVPITFGGAARHNVANALAALGAAAALGLPEAAMRDGLAGFSATPVANPGRANTWNFAGVTAIVDFAHNPHGIAALAAMAAAMPASRRALVIGQAGDRDDGAIRGFARAAWAMRPDRVFIKEMRVHLRGREPGVVPAMLADEFQAAGASADVLEHHASELEAVRAALAWARGEDLLLLTTHAQRDEVLALMERLERDRWQPGQPLPA